MEVRHARPGADERRLEHPGIGSPADDDDVVGAGRLGQLLDDRTEDRVGRHRPRQARQDPGERLGLLAAPDLERRDGLAVADRGEADDDDEADEDQSIGRRRVRRRAGGRRSGTG